MSGNANLPFFAVEYENRRVGIRRTADYDDMINHIRRAFPSLSDIPSSQISVAQVFPELGEGAIEISRDLWTDVMPLVKTAQVVVFNVEPDSIASKKRKMLTLEKESGPGTSCSNTTAPSITAVVATTCSSIGSDDASITDPMTRGRVTRSTNTTVGLTVGRRRKTIYWGDSSDEFDSGS